MKVISAIRVQKRIFLQMCVLFIPALVICYPTLANPLARLLG